MMKGCGLSLILGICLIVLLALPCHAEFYIGGHTGKAFTMSHDLKIEQPSRDNDFICKDVSFDDKSFEPPMYYGLKAGYFFPRLLPVKI